MGGGLSYEFHVARACAELDLGALRESAHAVKIKARKTGEIARNPPAENRPLITRLASSNVAVRDSRSAASRRKRRHR